MPKKKKQPIPKKQPAKKKQPVVQKQSEKQSEIKRQPVRRRHSKLRTILIISIPTIFLASVVCLVLCLVLPHFTREPVDPAELPTIQTDALYINMCPNGKPLDFKFKVIDTKDGDITSSAQIVPAFGGAIIKATDSDQNESSVYVPAIVSDKTPPTINLNGDTEYTVLIGKEFEPPIATAKDNCDGELAVETSGSFDTSKKGNYVLTYTATDSSGNQTTVKRSINVTDNTGVIYLTFDDGPSGYTGQLLDVLKKYNVKATFFVTNNGSDDMIRREYDEGHTVGLHSATHDYGYIYQNTDNYFADLSAVHQRVKNITGQDPHLIRFPGGSSNTISRKYDGGEHIMSKLVGMVKEKGYTYFDWNLSSGDASNATTADAVYENVINRLAPDQQWIILQHDIKGYSVDAVERIIQYGQEHGYTFKKLDENSFTAAHGVAN